MPINSNQALFSLLGTTYGGDGRTTFALPNLRARAPLHVGAGINLGQTGGETTHTLTQSEMPTHTHALLAESLNANHAAPVMLAAADGAYGPPNALTSVGVDATNGPSVTSTGGSGAHENMPPYSVVNFIIALQGIFPSRS
jgi:microcystin-dependent protein